MHGRVAMCRMLDVVCAPEPTLEKRMRRGDQELRMRCVTQEFERDAHDSPVISSGGSRSEFEIHSEDIGAQAEDRKTSELNQLNPGARGGILEQLHPPCRGRRFRIPPTRPKIVLILQWTDSQEILDNVPLSHLYVPTHLSVLGVKRQPVGHPRGIPGPKEQKFPNPATESKAIC